MNSKEKTYRNLINISTERSTKVYWSIERELSRLEIIKVDSVFDPHMFDEIVNRYSNYVLGKTSNG